MITFGKTPAIKYYEDLKLTEIRIKKPKNRESLLNRILNEVDDVDQANVCLSGGIDSQLVLRIATKLNVSVTAYTYLLTWGESPLNTDDYVYAVKCAEKENVKLVTIPIDLEYFLKNNLHIKYGKLYNIASPQIAAHLYFLDQIKNIPGTFFLGGEYPYLSMNSDIQQGPGDIAGLSPSFLMRGTFAYRRYAEINNIKIVKDILLYSPEIIYETLKVSINIVKKYKVHSEKNYYMGDFTLPHMIKFKLYEEIVPGGIDPLYKGTGFEKIKKYLASTSGIYNKFDIDYRENMVALYNKNLKTLGKAIDGTTHFFLDESSKKLTSSFRNAIKKYKSTPVDMHFIDF